MAVWDSLFVLLVLVPFVTGGIWLRKPGLQLEYTQAGPAALVLLLALAWMMKRKRNVTKNSAVCRFALEKWKEWSQALERTPTRPLLVAWLAVALFWFLSSLSRHLAFGSGVADLAIFTNAIWNVSVSGVPFSSIKGGISLLADHQDFLVYPLGWIFKLWRSPVFLLLLQAFGLSLGAIALYGLGRQRLGKTHPIVPWLPLMYWLCGPLRAANLFDFHPEVFMLPLFLTSIWLLQEKKVGRRAVGILFFLTALAAKESAGPVACGLGLAWILEAGPQNTRYFTRRFGWVAIVFGLTFFVIDSRYIPYLAGGRYSYSELYAPFGSSPFELLLAPFRYPAEFFHRLFSLSRIKFLFGILLPLGFLPLFAPSALVAALPGFLMLFLSAGEQRISLGYHYAIEPMVGLLFALPIALESVKVKRYLPALLPFWMAAALLSYGRSDTYYWRHFSATNHQAWVRKEVLKKIGGNLSISASYALVPHLSTRRWASELSVTTDERNVPVDCVLVDNSVNNTPLSNQQLYEIQARLERREYKAELRCGTFTLYRKKNIAACLMGPPPSCPERS
ncbi:MAG TPA: DUF2079 domain-containing protein [Bdellovibrionota bacterium]|jgi:uncharacterized membrane protein